MELRKIIGKAIEFEQKGRAVYEEAAFKTKHKEVAKVFMFLAEEEKKHEQWIRNYVEGQETEPKEVSRAKDFFLTSTKEFRRKIVLSEDDIGAYENAMQFEKESYEFYSDWLKKLEKEPRTEAFLKLLIAEEQSHYDLLEQTRDYLKDPDLFYQRQEGWLFEGG